MKKRITFQASILLMATFFIFGAFTHATYQSTSPSKAKAKLSLYSDLTPVDGNKLHIEVRKQSDPEFYYWLFVLDQKYDEIVIEYDTD